MSDQDCTCGEVEPAHSATNRPSAAGWVDQQPVQHAQLPSDVASRMSEFFGETIVTFDDFVSVVRSVGGEDGIAVDEPAEIHTESPAGTPIEMRASPDTGVQVSQSGAVMSFGITGSDDVSADEEPTAQDIYSAICPYVKAFLSREEYDNWARAVPAATVGIPHESGVPIAAALTADSVNGEPI
jgi:hypothetical protein